MDKRTIPQNVKREIDRYIQILRDDQLPISKAYIFGSYAKGKAKKWSDIDVCVISPNFSSSQSALQYLWSKRDIRDPRVVVEPVGFSPKDFEDKFDSLVQEIKKTGIEVEIDTM